MALPVIDVYVFGKNVKALVDTGCSKSVLGPNLCDVEKRSCSIIGVDGRKIECRGEVVAPISVNDRVEWIECVVAEKLFDGIDAILGMDFVNQRGGVTLIGNLVKFFDKEVCETKGVVALTCETAVEDTDFSAKFNGQFWTVSWRWKEGRPPQLKNRIGCYESTKKPEVKDKFDKELEEWIRKGWLKPYLKNEGEGIIPLMAVVQPTKHKVRPVMDFREINDFVESHPGFDAAVCDETIRRWRRLPEKLKLLDLKSAYLQIRVDENLWPFQQVFYNGKFYVLTRLGFGLNCAPKVMTKILKTVLAMDDRVQRGTDSYIDDIIVDETIITAGEVADHLLRYGLETKPAEALEGTRVLGLLISRDANDKLTFSRGNEIPIIESDENLTRRQLFSICGRLVGHYPVCGWLRVACSYVKRKSEGKLWDDFIGDEARAMIREVVSRVRTEDPVRGLWKVAVTEEGKVWCDASSLALGVALEIDGVIVEDATWLRKAADSSHINVAELEAVLKGVNLALKWDLRSIKIMTDSATVLGWLNSILTGDCRVKVTGLSEMLVKRRLSIIKDLITEYRLVVEAFYVESNKNKADSLTRVKKSG